MHTTPHKSLPPDACQADRPVWPSTEAGGVPQFSVSLELDDLTLRLVRELQCGDASTVRTIAWSASYLEPADATNAYDALSLQGDRLGYWSVGATVFGTDWLTPTVDAYVSEYVEERDQAQAQAARETEELMALAEKDLAAATQITAYYRMLKKRFAVTLEYGSDDDAFWSIKFDEAWERDRFWDWLKWQRNRFEEFAEFMKDGDRLDLERKLLREMLLTEQTVKKQGLGAGGRRPLRFWRGEV